MFAPARVSVYLRVLLRDGGREYQGETGSQLNVDRKDTEGLSHFHKAWASVGTGLSQQVAENVSALWTGGCWAREEHRRGNKGEDGTASSIVGGKAGYQGHAKCKADTGITLWQGRGWHSRTLGP